MLANLFRMRYINGTGVGLLLGHANFGEQFDNGLGLDLKFAGQIVDANLIGVLRHTQGI
jgi:hypothetical protein